MGKQAQIVAATVLAVLLAVASPLCAHAQSVADLYALYGIESSDVMPSELRKTLIDYNSAMVYAAKYSGISSVTSDYSVTEKRIAEYKARLEECYETLRGGYYMDFSEILATEREILDLTSRISDAERSMAERTIKMPEIDVDSVPSTSQYKKALAEKEKYSTFVLGNVTSVQVPATGKAEAVYHSPRHMTVLTSEDASALALFNGTVVLANGDYVRVNCGNNVFYEYHGLSEILVEVGDVLEQYQRVGRVNERFQVSLSIDGYYRQVLDLLGGDK